MHKVLFENLPKTCLLQISTTGNPALFSCRLGKRVMSLVPNVVNNNKSAITKQQ